MKSFDDLTEKEKLHFNSLYTIKTLYHQDLVNDINLSILIFIIAFMTAIGVLITCFGLVHLYYQTGLSYYLESATGIFSIGQAGIFILVMVSVLMLFVSAFDKIKYKKNLYLLFGTDSIIEDEMKINNEERKKMRESYKKVK